MTYIDIETAPYRSGFEKLPDEAQALWTEKYANRYPELGPAESYKERAALHPEFGRIVCVTLAQEHKGKLFMKSIAGNMELPLLNAVAIALSRADRLCGHNIKRFDVPYLCKRMASNRIMLPPPLRVLGKKPWEVPHDDTMEMWKFGGTDASSLAAMCHCLGVPSPKSGMDGSMVGDAFFAGKHEEIAEYCHLDVYATADCHSVITKNERLGLEKEHHVQYFVHQEE